MSTDQTPIDVDAVASAAVQRAEGAIYEKIWGGPRDEDRSPDVDELADARAALSAALTNDADPDWLARSVCDATEGWEHSDQTDDHPCTRCKTQADAVRAAILGADQ